MRCYAPHNPHYYKKADGGLYPINLDSIDRSAKSKIGNITKLTENWYTAGVRNDLKGTKLFGLRKDEKQDGEEQFEVTPLGLKIDGLEGSLTATKAKTKKTGLFDFGQFITSHTRQGSRIYLPYRDKAFDSFEMRLRIDTVGIKPIYRADLDEYWFYNDERELFCRLRKPNLFFEDTLNPVWLDLDIDQQDIIGHSLEENADGSYTYVKYSTDALKKLDIPEFLIDADIYYSEISDGTVYSYGSNFTTVITASTGAVVYDAVTVTYLTGAVYDSRQRQYEVYRGFMIFDTDGSATPSSAKIKIYGAYLPETGGYCYVFEGTQASTLTTSDWDNFTGNSFDDVPWQYNIWNTFELDQDGIDSINTSGNSKFCFRHQCDVDGAYGVSQGYNRANFAESTGYEPYLELVCPVAFASNLTGQSSFSDIDITRDIKITGDVNGHSALSNADLAVERKMASSVSAASDFLDIRLGDSIQFQTSIGAIQSVFSSINLGLTLKFVSSINAGSDISSADLFVLRKIASEISSGSSLGSANLNINRKLAGSVLANSALSASLNILRRLESSLSGVSAFSEIDLAVLRRLAGNVSAGSILSSPDLSILRPLQSSIVGESLFLEISVNVLRKFLSALMDSSTMSGIDLDILITALKFYSSINAASLFSGVSVDVMRPFQSSIVSVSDVSDIDLQVLRRFLGNIEAASSLSDAFLSVLMRMASSINMASTISNARLKVLRRMASSIDVTSSFSDITIWLANGIINSVLSVSDASRLFAIVGKSATFSVFDMTEPLQVKRD